MENVNQQTKPKFINIRGALLGEFGLLFFLLGLIVFFSFASPYFLKFGNLINMLVSISILGILSTAMTTCIIVRGPDLSVSAIVAMVGCVQSKIVVETGLPWYVGILVSLLVGLIVGYLNGLIIVKFSLPPLIVTLGMMNVVRGLCYVLTDGKSTFIREPHLTFLGRETIGGFPLSVLIMLACFALFEFITKKTVFGRQVFASGGNRIAARLAGINVNRVVIGVFTISSVMATLTGMVMVGIGGTALPSMGESYGIDAITTVLLGGTSLEGGAGSVAKTLSGLVIIGVLNNGMTLMNVPSYWQITAKGALLLAAIIFDKVRNR